MEPFRKGRLPAFGPVQKSFTGFTGIAPGPLILAEPNPSRMAKTRTPSKATRPKANTVKWWLMKLPEPIRSKALKACDNPDRKVNSVAHAIADGFSWVDTKDGHAYWTKVSNRAMAGEFDPKKSPPKSKTKAPKKKPTQLDRIEDTINALNLFTVTSLGVIMDRLTDIEAKRHEFTLLP